MGIWITDTSVISLIFSDQMILLLSMTHELFQHGLWGVGSQQAASGKGCFFKKMRRLQHGRFSPARVVAQRLESGSCCWIDHSRKPSSSRWLREVRVAPGLCSHQFRVTLMPCCSRLDAFPCRGIFEVVSSRRWMKSDTRQYLQTRLGQQQLR